MCLCPRSVVFYLSCFFFRLACSDETERSAPRGTHPCMSSSSSISNSTIALPVRDLMWVGVDMKSWKHSYVRIREAGRRKYVEFEESERSGAAAGWWILRLRRLFLAVSVQLHVGRTFISRSLFLLSRALSFSSR